jgi:hypothetical protein
MASLLEGIASSVAFGYAVPWGKGTITVIRIAVRHGFRRAATLWDHPENAELRALRASPEVLAPGDRVFVPHREEKAEEAETTVRTTFMAPRPRECLRVKFHWSDGAPMADRPCELVLGAGVEKASTGANGLLDHPIPVGLTRATVFFDGDDAPWELHIGHLDPVDEPVTDRGRAGAIGRLRNLGRYQLEGADDQHLRVASCAFCEDVTREDAALAGAQRARLREAHGC